MMMAMNGMKIPDTFYISHGSPTLSIDETMPARHFLQSFQQKVYPPTAPRPSSILVISGHWETEYPTVNAVDGVSETIYDFYGFPKSMYQELEGIEFGHSNRNWNLMELESQFHS
ncbi:putative stizolobate synthase [Helianthus annuus]|nr:putative stizolobate synthase [Helianthus annuus]